MRPFDHRLAAAVALAALLACSGETPSAPAAAPSRGEPAPATAPASPQPDPAAQGTGAQHPAGDGASVAAKPAAAAAAKPDPAPGAAAPASGAKPAASAAASARAKVGPDKCRMCHRVEHQSWAQSAHAKKGLDCEGCHGNGGDYWPAAVMRDRAKAVSAGLVQPEVERCRKCHPKADASLLPKAHAHKAR